MTKTGELQKEGDLTRIKTRHLCKLKIFNRNYSEHKPGITVTAEQFKTKQ